MPEPQLEAPPGLIDRTLFEPSSPSTAGSGVPQPTRRPWLEVQAGERGVVTLVNGPLLGATPGSTWSIYPPGDNLFTPGRALAIATVTHITGKDAVATITSSAGQIPTSTRAIALLPAPTGHRIPVRILDMPAGTRKVVEKTLRTNLKDVEFVGLEEPARFSVDVEGDTLRLLAADGLQVIGTFGLKEPWGAAVATVVSRFGQCLRTVDPGQSLFSAQA